MVNILGSTKTARKLHHGNAHH